MPPSCCLDRSQHTTTGIDEYLQGVGGDPFHGISRVGLRVPPLATPLLRSGGADLRYLFQAFAIGLPPQGAKRIRRLGQYVRLGALAAATRPTELAVGSVDNGGDPTFRFPNGDISWHLRVVQRTEIGALTVGTYDANNFKYRYCLGGAALLYEDAVFPAGHLNASGRPDYYTSLTSYSPPNLGRPWGRPVSKDLGTFYGVQYPYQNYGGDLDICVEGPGILTGFISVRQTLIAGRVAIPDAVSSSVLSREEAFVRAFPDAATYWAVGMSVDVEDVP